MPLILNKRFSFNTIATLQNVSKGESAPLFEQVQDSLAFLGYMSASGLPIIRGTLDAKTETALKSFQQAYRLKETGVFDEATRKALSADRCGLPDRQPQASMGTGIAASASATTQTYTIGVSWRRRHLTYAFGNMTNQAIGEQAARVAVNRACATFTATGCVLLQEVALIDLPDIIVEWRPAEDPDQSMVGNTIAHAEFPPGYDFIRPGLPRPVHFDDEEHTWTNGIGGFDIETVALHEFGHILGLTHNAANTAAVMTPFALQNTSKHTLQPDDLASLHELYSPPILGDSIGYTLEPGTQLKPGQRLKSKNRFYELVYQTDGNLVLYDGNKKPHWSSNTHGTAPGRAIMQTDGNFVIYNASNQSIWHTGTHGNPGSHITLQNDRNFVLYKDKNPLWNTRTHLPPDPFPRHIAFPEGTPSVGESLTAGMRLNPGERILSDNRFFELIYQTDGNLVLYDYHKNVYWSSNTSGTSAGHAAMQSDGNFVIYNANNRPVWSTNTHGQNGASITMQGDRNIVIYKDRNPIWSSNTHLNRNPGMITGTPATATASTDLFGPTRRNANSDTTQDTATLKCKL